MLHGYALFTAHIAVKRVPQWMSLWGSPNMETAPLWLGGYAETLNAGPRGIILGKGLLPPLSPQTSTQSPLLFIFKG